MLQIGQEGLTDFLTQGQPHRSVSLATHPDGGVRPVDVTESKMHDLAGSETQTGEQQQDRVVPTTNTGRSVTGGE